MSYVGRCPRCGALMGWREDEFHTRELACTNGHSGAVLAVPTAYLSPVPSAPVAPPPAEPLPLRTELLVIVTACNEDHAVEGGNRYVRFDKRRNTQYVACRICWNAHKRERARRKKEEAA